VTRKPREKAAILNPDTPKLDLRNPSHDKLITKLAIMLGKGRVARQILHHLCLLALLLSSLCLAFSNSSSVGSELLAFESHLDIMDERMELNLSFLSALRCEMAKSRSSSSLFFVFLSMFCTDQLQVNGHKMCDLRSDERMFECYEGKTYFTPLSNGFVGGSISEIFLAHLVYALVDFSSPATGKDSEYIYTRY
jgi:hypothetical protein